MINSSECTLTSFFAIFCMDGPVIREIDAKALVEHARMNAVSERVPIYSSVPSHKECSSCEAMITLVYILFQLAINGQYILAYFI